MALKCGIVTCDSRAFCDLSHSACLPSLDLIDRSLMHHRPLPFISGNMGRPVFSRITSLCVTIHDPDIRSVPKYPTSEGVLRLEIRSIFNIYWSNIARRLGTCRSVSLQVCVARGALLADRAKSRKSG
jgi:hypothetical protein